MSAFTYSDAPVPSRGDIAAAHRGAWERLAAPGNWWTGAERVAIAAEVRNAAKCALCSQRKAALSPEAAQGPHDRVSELPDPALDVVHRVTTDPGRLTRTWFERTLAAGLSDAQYVEIVGVVVAVVSIDSFHRGLGLAPEPLPEPEPGEASRYRPASARSDGAWVPMIDKASGDEADLWRGRTANVIRAMSLVPDAVRQLKDLSRAHYLPLEMVVDASASRGSLTRPQMELIAGRVSALNECFY